MQSHFSISALAAVGAGGAVGSVARYVLGAMVQRVGPGFPYGTLAVSVSLAAKFMGFAVAKAVLR